MKIFENTLTINAVSIQSEEYGMRAYVNSARGRAELEAECPTEIVQEVYAVWGDTPNVTEPTFPMQPVPQGPTLEDRVKALEAAQLAALGV